MRKLRPAALLLLLVLGSCTHQPKELVSTAPDSFNFVAILGDYPPDGSPEQKSEIDTMLKLQADRTPEEISRCVLEVDGTPIGFGAMAMGSWFNEYEFPATATLLRDVTEQIRPIVNAAKANWNRKRPFAADERIIPCVHVEKTPSYPSGHATRAMVWALVLSNIFPDHRKELLARAIEFGTDRTLAGMHYPSDVAAGQKLGREIAHRILADPEYQERLEKCEVEAHAGAHH